MGPIGVPELIILLVVALIVFGPRKLPELGRSLGRSIGEFKRASNELRNTLDEEIRAEERKPPPAPPEVPSSDPRALSAPTSPDTIARGEQGS
jgi:TatA/E family protein of Tat protein translocase